jgi:hypothetical protein
MSRGAEKKKSPSDSSDHTGDSQGDYYSPGDIQVLAIGASTRRDANPQGNGVRSVGGNGRDTGKQERGESHETSSACNRIKGPAKRTRQKNEDGDLEFQVTDVSQRAETRPEAGTEKPAK